MISAFYKPSIKNSLTYLTIKFQEFIVAAGKND